MFRSALNAAPCGAGLAPASPQLVAVDDRERFDAIVASGRCLKLCACPKWQAKTTNLPDGGPPDSGAPGLARLSLKRWHLNELQQAMVAAKIASLQHGATGAKSPIGDLLMDVTGGRISAQQTPLVANPVTSSTSLVLFHHLGESPMTSNLDLAKKAYALFQKGDVQSLISELTADDCRYLIAGPKDKLSWAGEHSGKAQIGNFFKLLSETTEYSKFEPLQMLEGGDTVVTIGVMAGRNRATGKEFEDNWVHVIRYRDGKSVFFQAYFDTAKAVAVSS
jgi:uncharacterized protein